MVSELVEIVYEGISCSRPKLTTDAFWQPVFMKWIGTGLLAVFTLLSAIGGHPG